MVQPIIRMNGVRISEDVNVCRKDLLAYTEETVTNPKDKKVIKDFLNGKVVKSSRQQRKAFRFVSTAVLAVSTYVSLNTPAVMAASLTGEEQQTLGTIDGVLLKIQLICLGICVGLAILMAMVAGFFRILGLREEAKKRYMDAIAGMMMVLTAPVVLGVLATVVRSFLKLFPNYGV